MSAEVSMTIALWILAVDVAALAIVWLVHRRAPFGYQDRTGFHRGVPQSNEHNGPGRHDRKRGPDRPDQDKLGDLHFQSASG
jgi:hypothetical protein